MSDEKDLGPFNRWLMEQAGGNVPLSLPLLRALAIWRALDVLDNMIQVLWDMQAMAEEAEEEKEE